MLFLFEEIMGADNSEYSCIVTVCNAYNVYVSFDLFKVTYRIESTFYIDEAT